MAPWTLWWRTPRWCRGVVYVGLLVALTFSGTVGSICYRIHAQNRREGTTGLPCHPAPHAGSRILVISPHPDDETIACGGLIHDAVQAGAAVQVVFVTNGDGFRVAVRRAYPRVSIGPADFVRFGAMRRGEARRAVAALGVPPDHVLFLGYPDRGIAHLWLSHWTPDHPYTSPYTRVAADPYQAVYRPGAPYCGQALLDDLQKIIRDFDPTEVYIPHPNDDHPDHWATSCFARAALERDGLAGRVPAYTYLVHRGDWPVPQGAHPKLGLAPPAAMAHLDTAWSAYPLTQAAEDAKESALSEHRSQVSMMGRFLKSFVRRTELYGTIQPASVPELGSGVVKVDGNSADWAAIVPAVEEPTGDSLAVEVEGGADLASIRVCQDDRYLYLLLTSRRELSSLLQYVFHLRGLDGKGCALAISVSPKQGQSEPGIHAVARGHCVEVAVPLARLAGARTLFVGASARSRRFSIDTTGWRIVRVNEPSEADSVARRPGTSPATGSTVQATEPPAAGGAASTPEPHPAGSAARGPALLPAGRVAHEPEPTDLRRPSQG